jgi:spore coat protein U-like protein
MRAPLALPLAAALLPCAAIPVAAETSRSFEVSARIVAGCSVAADTAGRWGTIALGSVAGVPGSSAGATLVSVAGAGIAIDCTPGLSATLSADAGDNPDGTARRLKLAGGAATIGYTLFADGSQSAWSAPLPLTFAGTTRLVPIRAAAALSAPAAAGTYADTVRVTLSW